MTNPTGEQKSEYYRMSRKSNFEGSMSLMSSSPNVMVEEKVSHLSNLTDEQRVEMREKAAESKRIAKEWAEENLTHEYKDEKYWLELSKKYGARLPQSHIPGSEIKCLRRIAKKLNYDVSLFLEETGFANLKAFAEANPNWGARSLAGLVLEAFVEYEKSGENGAV